MADSPKDGLGKEFARLGAIIASLDKRVTALERAVKPETPPRCLFGEELTDHVSPHDVLNIVQRKTIYTPDARARQIVAEVLRLVAARPESVTAYEKNWALSAVHTTRGWEDRPTEGVVKNMLDWGVEFVKSRMALIDKEPGCYFGGDYCTKAEVDLIMGALAELPDGRRKFPFYEITVEHFEIYRLLVDNSDTLGHPSDRRRLEEFSRYR